MTEPPERTRRVRRKPTDPNKYLSGQKVERYEVGERLGAGGMGEVYRAWDPLLKRTVALKRVAVDKFGDVQGREQLLNEARALSSLSHRAIASVFDVVESHEQLFIVEEFVSGTSLRQRLTRPLDFDTFFPIAEGCLSALDEAGRQGIVHCDIKPENIVLTEEGRPKILDFGLARRASPSRGGDLSVTTRLTDSSQVRGGTTSYMAPEALVESRADARSDLWALGVVFYEMLTGRHPFRRENATETAKSILADQPEEPSHLRAEVSAELDCLVMSMLTKDPEARAASASELLAALRGDAPMPTPARPAPPPRRLAKRVAVFAGTAAIAVAAWVAWEMRPVTAATGPPVYLAVEPFGSPGVDPHAEFFALGFVEAAAECLRGVEGLSVVPADTWFRVDARLRGSVHRAVDRLRVTYELEGPAGAVTGGVLHGGTDQLFTLRDQLAGNVSRILADRLGLEALPPEGGDPPATNSEAYAAYLRGVGYLERADEPGRAADAVEHLEEAIEADPAFVPARIRLGEALWRSAEGDEPLAARAREIARAAVEAAPDRPDAHRVLGWILLEAGEAEAAEEELGRAFELDTADEEASRLLARAQRQLGRPDDATATLTRAAGAHPDDWLLQRNLGRHLYALGRLEEGLLAGERMVALTPGNARGKSTLGAMYFYLGRNDQAIDSYLESVAIEPNHRAFSNIGAVYMAEGRYEEAATNLEAALDIDDRDYRVWMNLAVTYDLLGGREAESGAATARAIGLAEAALAAAPDDGVVLSLLAGSYAMAERPDDARRTIARALELVPDDMDVLFHAAGVFEKLGEREIALGLARRALEAGFPLRMMEDESGWRDLTTSPEFREIVTSLQGAIREQS